MGEGRIILHVGSHKTGTTSFQAALAANAGTLKARGIGVVSLPKWHRVPWLRTTFNLTGFAHLFIRPELATGPRLRGTIPLVPADTARARRDKVAASLASRPEPDLLLSSEAFCFLRTGEEAERIRALLARSGRTPLILLVLRNEAAWRESWKNHLKHSLRIEQGIAELPDERRPEGDWYFDRAALTGFWAGLGELKVLDYDAEKAAHGSVLPGLFAAFGIDAADLTLDFTRNKRRKWRWPHALQRPFFSRKG